MEPSLFYQMVREISLLLAEAKLHLCTQINMQIFYSGDICLEIG